MKKQMVLVVIGLLSVFLIFGSALAWQGRMAGMGDPYGLVQDESDMLIHPAMIMKSSGTRFYSHYRFTYTDVMDWDYEWDFEPIGFSHDFKASGDEYKHEALIGSAFNLGFGRMGVFFTYENQNGNYDGEIDPNFIGVSSGMDFDLESDKNDFTLSLLYGFPIDCIDIGFEAGFAYHNEENKISQEFTGIESTNPIFDILLYPLVWSNIYTYMIPYDSEYYETFAKASVASELGCNADFGFTLKGGYIFIGDNELDSDDDVYALGVEMDGDVEGWSLGGDFWLRYKVDDSLSLPFLISAGYQEKVRDGDGSSNWGGIEFDYEHKEMSWNIEAGGGVDINFDNKSKIASGIYYQYFENNNDFILGFDAVSGSYTDMDSIPDYDEHRITLKLAYEKEVSSSVGFRAGFDCFYGWADWDYKNDWINGTAKESVSMDGELWGIGLTLGGTIKIDPVTLEPFIGVAYQETNLDGDGSNSLFGADIKGVHERNQWLVSTGLSILF